MEYTKGEWGVSGDRDVVVSDIYQVAGSLYKIADITHHLRDETIANAHLIAAAPAIYEALKDLATLIECKEVAKGKELDNAFKALAQARRE